MKRSGKLLGLAALLTAALAFAPAAHADPELTQELRAMRQELRELREYLTTMRELTESRGKQAALERDMLRERLARLERRLDALQTTPPLDGRGAGSFVPEPRDGTGTIRLRNRFDVPAQFTLNGVVYRVPARGMRVLPGQPAGSLFCEVWAPIFDSPSQRRTVLRPNTTLTLTFPDPALDTIIDLP
jgi:hypothetical protein